MLNARLAHLGENGEAASVKRERIAFVALLKWKNTVVWIRNCQEYQNHSLELTLLAPNTSHV